MVIRGGRLGSRPWTAGENEREPCRNIPGNFFQPPHLIHFCPMTLIIFTDLDGTLLDRESYSWEPARTALERCRQSRVPVVAVTSKTLAETRVLSEEIGLDPRFIFENGGGICLEDGGYLPLGIPYGKLRHDFAILATRFHLRGMGDMSIPELVQMTGLTRGEALLAKERLFSEPFLYVGDELAELEAAAAGQGLQVIRGGRFYHLMAEKQSKGNAVRKWVQQFGDNFDRLLFTAALGDSPNDFSMLAVVDYPFLVRQENGQSVSCSLESIARTRDVGPAGWSEAVMQLLDNLSDACRSGKENCNV
ncbi:MAG: HAD hydrolase family protein [Xanthomonadaceae bacterium]|nr:HAD hydrolase family protein [Xanthomonadaceae bacterium]